MSDNSQKTYSKHSVSWREISYSTIENLYQLASTDFQIEAFDQIISSFGWEFDKKQSCNLVKKVEVENDLWLQLSISNLTIRCGVLTLAYWEEFEPEWHDHISMHKKEKEIYNSIYENLHQKTLNTLNRPFFVGKDEDRWSDNYSVWNGSNGLLFLQQCGYDLQFGREINFWLEPCSKKDFKPTSPLIDWLNNNNNVNQE